MKLRSVLLIQLKHGATRYLVMGLGVAGFAYANSQTAQVFYTFPWLLILLSAILTPLHTARLGGQYGLNRRHIVGGELSVALGSALWFTAVLWLTATLTAPRTVLFYIDRYGAYDLRGAYLLLGTLAMTLTGALLRAYHNSLKLIVPLALVGGMISAETFPSAKPAGLLAKFLYRPATPSGQPWMSILLLALLCLVLVGLMLWAYRRFELRPSEVARPT